MRFNIKLKSSDGKIFKRDIKIVNSMQTICDMLKNLGPGNDGIIPLTEVSSTTLEMVLTWAEHHKDDDIKTLVLDKEFAIPEWDEHFLDISQESLFDLIHASHYLKLEPLLLIGCKKLANMIKGKTPAQIRETFNLTYD